MGEEGEEEGEAEEEVGEEGVPSELDPKTKSSSRTCLSASEQASSEGREEIESILSNFLTG